MATTAKKAAKKATTRVAGKAGGGGTPGRARDITTAPTYRPTVATGPLRVTAQGATLKDDDREYLSDNVLARKAVQIVTDSVVLVKEDAEKKPAKKAAKKADDAGEAAEKPAKKATKKAEPKE